MNFPRRRLYACLPRRIYYCTAYPIKSNATRYESRISLKGNSITLPSQRYSLPEMPRSIMWFKNVICIGFNYEYSMMDALTGDVADILRIRNTFPYMKILPDDRIMLNDNSRFLRNVARFYSRT
jgi:hypothetical protein